MRNGVNILTYFVDLKLHWVEKYLCQEKCTTVFVFELVVDILARFVAENSSVTNPASRILK